MEFHASLHKFAVHTHRKGLKNSSGISARLRDGNANNRKRNSYVIVVVVVVVTRGKHSRNGNKKRENLFLYLLNNTSRGGALGCVPPPDWRF